MLLHFPHDVQSLIFRKLHLNEIGNIRQTCSTLNCFVTSDKQLWLHILQRDIKSKALPLPRCTRNIEESTAQDALEWVKNSIILDKSYTTGENTTLIRENVSMSVTWVRLVRGRWCLIACSDLRESQLVVWDLRTSQAERHKSTLYLPGPVADGVVEDSKNEILIALTIGTKIASILLLELFTDENEVFARKVAEIPAASHVRLLKRPYVGFSVCNGDDTNPYIMNWETGYSRLLACPDPVEDLAINPENLLALSHAPCRGMFIWRNRVFVFYTCKLVVFGKAGASDRFDDGVLSDLRCIRVHYLNGAFLDFCALNYEDQPNANGFQDTSQSILCEGNGIVATLTIRYDEDCEAPGKLVFVEPTDCLELPILEKKYESQPTRIALGPACRRFLTLAYIHHISYPLPTLYVSKLISNDESVAFGPAIPLSAEGMPLLYEATSMDFDDGSGLLVVGTLGGEVCVRTFGGALPLSGLNSGLPSSRASPDFTVRTPVSLPTIYEVYGSIPSLDKREKLIEDAFRAWGSAIPAPNLPGWSSDWSQFQNLDLWVASFSRWGILDKIADVDTVTSTRIRYRIGTLGDMIPVLYDESNHYRVLFRIGDRLYYCKARSGDPDDYDPDFEMIDYPDILGILPISYSQFLETDVRVSADIIRDIWIQRNVELDYSSRTADQMLNHVRMLNRVREAFAKQNGEYPSDSVLESWSKSDWYAMRKLANFRTYD